MDQFRLLHLMLQLLWAIHLNRLWPILFFWNGKELIKELKIGSLVLWVRRFYNERLDLIQLLKCGRLWKIHLIFLRWTANWPYLANCNCWDVTLASPLDEYLTKFKTICDEIVTIAQSFPKIKSPFGRIMVWVPTASCLPQWLWGFLHLYPMSKYPSIHVS